MRGERRQWRPPGCCNPSTGVGVLLLLAGIGVTVAVVWPGLVPEWERPVLADIDVTVSMLGVTSLVVLPRIWSRPRNAGGTRQTGGVPAEPGAVYATADLVEVLCGFAAEAEPASTSVPLAVTPAGRFDADTGLPPSTPVFTHFVPADVARSTSNVFGVDLGVPPRGAQGRFVSHPRSDLSVSKRDTLHEVVLVAIPPWDRDSVAAFDRSGRRLPLRTIEASPPEERLPASVDEADPGSR